MHRKLGFVVLWIVRDRLIEHEEVGGNPLGDLLPEAMRDAPRDITPKAIDEIDPLVDDIQHPTPNRQRAIVEIRDPRPVEVKLRAPVTGPRDVGAVVVAWHPDVAIVVAVDAGRMELKRRVIAGGVIDHEIEDDPDAGLVAAIDQRRKIGAVAQIRRRAEVVGDVVAVVGRAGEDRRQPQHVDAERFEILDPAFDLGKRCLWRLAGKRSHEDLIHRRRFGPRRRLGGGSDLELADLGAMYVDRVGNRMSLADGDRMHPESVVDGVGSNATGSVVSFDRPI